MSTDTVGLISDYVLGKDYTEPQFAWFKVRAEERFASEDPGLTPGQADQAVALLVCHQIYLKKVGGSDKQSESIGDYSYTRLTTGQLQGSTWLGQYQDLLKSKKSPQPSRGVERADAETSRAFQLSENKIPQMRYSDPNTRKP